MNDLKPFLDDMLSMSTGTDGRTLEIHFSRPVTKEDRQAFTVAHNAIVRGQLVADREGAEKLTVEEAWTILCETPDITSPEEYPDHALITMEQLGSFMARATPTSAIAISRQDALAPILSAETDALSIRAGTTITIDGAAHIFDAETPIILPALVAGEDYGVKLNAEGKPIASLLGPENPIGAGWVAGFHYAPGGNAAARVGGGDTPAINPHSLWDIGFRPSCPDPRGMARAETKDGRRFWIDVYMLGVDHKRNGTSRCGVKIADGNSLDRLNYHDATAIMAEHGKRLPTHEEFHAAAFGVTERSSAGRHPKSTGLDAARTSRFGLMQATGNLWVWGTDGDPDEHRASLFGGSWLGGSGAGSRCAYLDYWAGASHEVISARGASDHLSPE